MKKTLLIIQREYLTRVRKKTFIISTILFPLLYLLFIFGMGYLARKSSKQLRVAVIDPAGMLNQRLVAESNLRDSASYLEYVTANKDSVTRHFAAMGFDGYIVLPAAGGQQDVQRLVLRSEKTHGIQSVNSVQSKLNAIWNVVKYQQLGINEETRAALDRNRIVLESENLKDQRVSAGVASGVGYACAFLMYFILLIYGSQVMMGVIEEKTNRIAEVIVSSVRPFQLMLGKILGIGLVALTQFLLWIAFVFIVYNIGKSTGSSSSMMLNAVLENVQGVFSRINVPLVVFCFGFYLLGGFFFYAALYGAIGSAVNEDMREAQSLSFPITLLIIFSVAIMTAAIADPTGDLAFWGSIIPFSSPIVMMARIPFGVPGTVPIWQLVLSMALLVGGFLLTTWFAAKIYRTGILMYGKKPSWKEMMKWVSKG
jgi:ABC-2 type transport system permease protein